jgi:hypothetical protein
MAAQPIAELLEGLPGAEYFLQGIDDLRAGVENVPAYLVAGGAPRLAERIDVLNELVMPKRPELQLYRLLCEQHGNEAYGHYNAHLRRLTSFCRALEVRSARKSVRDG